MFPTYLVHMLDLGLLSRLSTTVIDIILLKKAQNISSNNLHQ